jgi:hypothetical protein
MNSLLNTPNVSKRLFRGLTTAAGLVLLAGALGGCAEADSAPQSSEAEANAVALRADPLWRFTADELAGTYASMLGGEVDAAAKANPDVAVVSKAGLARFAGSKELLKGSIDWYFGRTGTDSIEVAKIVETVVGAARPEIDGTVGTDGFVSPSRLNGKVAPQIVFVVDETWYATALGRAKAPTGALLRAIFDSHRGENGPGIDGVKLPVTVNRKPTATELGAIWGIDLRGAKTGDAARVSIGQIFDMVTLKDVDAAPGVKESWYKRVTEGGKEMHYAVFMDEHAQVWGFRVVLQHDD